MFSRTLFSNHRYRLTKNFITQSIKATDLRDHRTATAAPHEVQQLQAVLTTLDRIPLGPNSPALARAQVYSAFTMAILGVAEIYGLFMTQQAAVVAITFGTMPLNSHD